MRRRFGKKGAFTMLAAAALLVFALAPGLTPRSGAAAQAPSPGDTLLGQQITTCWYGDAIQLQVTGTQLVKTLDGVHARGNARWLVAFVNVTNLSSESASGSGAVQLQDERGRAFAYDSPGLLHLAHLEDQYGALSPENEFDPGVTVSGFVTFQVAPDVQWLQLLPDPGPECA
jgi:hypothetical protein